MLSLYLIFLCLGCAGSTANSGASNQVVNTTVNISGNWRLSTGSSVFPGTSTQIAGALTSSQADVAGIAHVSSSPCYASTTDVLFTGSLTGNTSAPVDSNIALMTPAINNQILSITGVISSQGTQLSGVYTITGGCGNGDKGAIGGLKITPLAGTFAGTVGPTIGPRFSTAAVLNQSSISDAHGIFHLTGSATFTGLSCISSATIANPLTDTSLSGTDFSITFTSTANAASQIKIYGLILDAGINRMLVTQYQIAGGACPQSNGGGTISLQ